MNLFKTFRGRRTSREVAVRAEVETAYLEDIEGNRIEVDSQLLGEMALRQIEAGSQRSDFVKKVMSAYHVGALSLQEAAQAVQPPEEKPVAWPNN